MIYLDSAATSLHKPPQVAQAAAIAILHLGNAGRGAHEATLSAGRVIYEAREKLAAFGFICFPGSAQKSL